MPKDLSDLCSSDSRHSTADMSSLSDSILNLGRVASRSEGSVAATGTNRLVPPRCSTSYEGGKFPPLCGDRQITRNDRPYRGCRGSRTWITSEKDSSSLAEGIFLRAFARRHRLADARMDRSPRGRGLKKRRRSGLRGCTCTRSLLSCAYGGRPRDAGRRERHAAPAAGRAGCELDAARAQIEALTFNLAVLQRRQFGQSSEKLDAEIEQLELRLEDLEESQAEQVAKRTQQEPRGNDRANPPCAGRCRRICRARPCCMNPRSSAPATAATAPNWPGSARTSPRCWRKYLPG